MNDERQRLAEQIFLELTEKDPAERSALLGARCAGDAALRSEVESLLAHLAPDEDFLDSNELLQVSLAAGRASVMDEAKLPPIQSAGGYTITRIIGGGGMGIVYVAEQEKPRRTVALKLIRPGMLSISLLRRFEHEADVLARLQHPGIAQIFDAGTADFGYGPQPFIAMELVDGQPLTEWCDRHRTGARPKLELFCNVCNAVHHAHQRAIIHRDLKPANILVNAQGEPKVLDFGVARVTDGDLQVTTLQTSVGQLIGTLPYMSPEQVVADPREVDTRSDVYALGVILYQLLAGRLPHDLNSRSIPEAARVIRDEKPARLSWISKVFRGEVETIVAKALEKEKDRRYQSAAALAEDVRRHLAGLPIAAKDDSALYVLRKQLRRYRGAVAAAAAFVILLSAFSVYATMQAGRERAAKLQEMQAKNEARESLAKEQAARREADAQRERADSEAEKLRRNLYASAIGFAQAACAGNDIERMRRLLHSCPEDLRGWEWRYLMRLSDDSESVVRYSEQPPSLNTLLSHDGRRAVVWRTGGHAAVIDAATGQELVRRERSGGAWFGVASPEGSAVYLSWQDGTLERVGLADGASRTIREAGAAALTLFGASPDDRLVLSSSQDQLTIWAVDAQSGRTLYTVAGGPYSAACLSPDGSRAAIGRSDGVVFVFDATTWALLGQRRCHTNNVKDIDFSMDNRRVASGGTDGAVVVWDLETNLARTFRPHANKVFTVQWSPDGTRIASSGTDCVIKFTDVESGAVLQTRRGHEVTVTRLAFEKDGRRFVSVGYDGTIRRWDLEAENEPVVHTPQHLLAGVVTPDGSQLLACGAGGDIWRWNARTLEPLPNVLAHTEGVAALQYSPDRSLLASAGHDGTAIIWDAATLAPRHRLEGHGGRVLELGFNPAGGVLATGADDGIVRIWEVATGRLLRALDARPHAITAVSYSPAGDELAVGERDGTVRILDTKSGSVKRTLEGLHGYPWSLVYTRDGSRLIAPSDGSSLIEWNLVDGTRRDFLGHKGAVAVAALSPDEKRLVSGGWDNTVRVWDMDSGEEVLTLRGHIGMVLMVAFSPSGDTLFTADNFDSMRVWHAGEWERASPTAAPIP